ncbi:membrane-targeted effector domain-containing toxin [Pseudomonas sp. SIMBA_077]
MNLPLERLKSAEPILHTLRQHLPTLDAAFNHRLCSTFPRLPKDSSTNGLHINHEAPAEPGQSPVLVSRSISSYIEECFLTQSPPAFVQGATHVYSQPYSLSEQHRAAGLAPADLESYLGYVIGNYDLCVRDAWAEFWQTPHAAFDSMTPLQWLTQSLQCLLLDEASVRLVDQTLSSTAASAVTQCFNTNVSRPTPEFSLGVYELLLKAERPMPDITLMGVFIIADQPLSREANPAFGKVVFYTTTSGLEEFDSLDLLKQELNARLNDPYQRIHLLNHVLEQEHAHTLGLIEVEVGATPQNAQLFLAQQLVDKLKKDMLHACATARRNKTVDQETLAPEYLSELIVQTLASSWVVNPAAILRSRYAHLLEQQLPQWLKTAPEDEKVAWRLATERLIHEQRASEAPGLQPITESGKRQTLLGYAKARLKRQIETDHGIEVDPDAIYVLTTEAVQTGPVIYPLGGSAYVAGNSLDRTGPTISYITNQLSLTQLALSNVGIWDITFALTAQIIDANGERHPVLTADYIKALVRQVDVGGSYKAHLNHLLNTSPQAAWRKERYIAVKMAQLRLDLLEAKMSGALNASQVAWVQAALDHPTGTTRPDVNGAQVNAHLLILKKNYLPGVMVFSATNSTDLLYYLPDAPDNTWFQVVSSRQELARTLSHQRWRDYLQQRVTAARWAYLKPVLEAGQDEVYSQLMIIYGNAFEVSYDNEVSYALRDADEQTTSTYESNLNTAKDAALAVVDVISFVLPTRVLLPLVALRFIFQITKGVDALNRDEEHEALLEFMGAIAHITDGASDFAGSAVFARAIRQRVKQPAPVLNPSVASTKIGSDLILRTGGEYGGGVYESVSSITGQTRHYLKDTNGNMYRSRYDDLDNIWRIIDERNPDSQYQLPVRELSAGRWDVDERIPFFNKEGNIGRVLERARVTDVNLSAHTADNQGIYHVNNQSYIQENGQTFKVYKGWLDRNLYLQTPGGAGSHSTAYKLRNSSSRWEIKLGPSNWKTLQFPHVELPVALPPAPNSHYDVPAPQVRRLQHCIDHVPRFKSSRYVFAKPEVNQLAKMFTELRVKLLTDAQAFLAKNIIKPRPARPKLPETITPNDFLKRLHEDFDGIVLGESHSDIGSKKVMMDYMKSLSKHKKKVIYLEHLQTDAHQSLLDDYFKTGKMDPVLDTFLKHQDEGHHVPASGGYTYSNLVREARRHGIKIKALDCMASYYSKGMPSGSSLLCRYEMFSYFASRVIRTHVAKTGGHKWIALTGNTHANTFEGVPGLSELEGAVGIRVIDVPANNKVHVRQDISDLITPAFGADIIFMKNDYWLEVNMRGADAKKVALTAGEIAAKLDEPGAYLFNNSPQGAQLIHRSNSNDIVHTPLQTTESGQFFIERQHWEYVHQKRYINIRELKQDLYITGLHSVE